MKITILRHSLSGLVLGAFIALLVMQHDSWVKERCGIAIKQAFAQAGNCRLQGTTDAINLAHAYIDFKDVHAQPCVGAAWHWKAKRMRVHFSWWHLLLYGSLELHIEFNDITGNSEYARGQLALMEHITAFMRASPLEIPTSIQGLSFNNALCSVTDPQSPLSCTVAWHSQSKRIANAFKSFVYVTDAGANGAHTPYLEKVQGTLQLDFYLGQPALQLYADLALTAQVPCLGSNNTTCFLKGSWQQNTGSFVVHNAERSIVCSPITCVKEKDKIIIKAQAELPLEDITNIVLGKKLLLACQIRGRCLVQTDIEITDGIDSLMGNMSVEKIMYAGLPLDIQGNISCIHKNHTWHGGIALKHGAMNIAHGTWAWDEQGSGFIKFANKQAVSLPGLEQWYIPQQALQVQCVSSMHGSTGTYLCEAQHNQTHEKVVIKGGMTSKHDVVTIRGSVQDITYNISGTLNPDIHLHRLLCRNKQGSTIMELSSLKHDKDRLQGFVAMELVKIMSDKTLGYNVQGEGAFDIRMLLGETITTKLHLNKGTIRLPHTYNFIKGLDAVIDVDYKERAVHIAGLVCPLYRGEVTCDKALITFDSAYTIARAHLPILMNRCLLNVNKDLFANISGRALLTKKEHEVPHIKGQFIVEQAQLKENILSTVFQKDVGSFASSMLVASNADMACDIDIATKEAVQVKTSFLDAKAKVNLHIKHTVRFPEIDGSIELLSGTLYFPYKPLYLTHGKICFMPGQLQDPLIELTAKNKIKKFNILMNITGSLADHNIALQSSPPLTEEQIVALLLTGSQEESLNIVMPALIMNNITNLIFGRDQSSLNLDRYFKKFLRPLSRVYLIPSFSDQTARGGLRGAVELDINDRWRALLQKNFNLSEDTRLEIECQLSDDISVRGIRDERRDVGGEVEMRWKF